MYSIDDYFHLVDIMKHREILHLYDLDHYDSERKYTYDHHAFYVGWTAMEMNDDLVQKCLRLNIPEVWTYETTTERSPRFRQWYLKTGEKAERKNCWVPPSEFLLYGWQPDIHFHFVYQIKKHLGFTTDDVHVSSDDMEQRRSLTTLGVHLT